MPVLNRPVEPSAFHELKARVDKMEAEQKRQGRQLVTVDRIVTADLPAPSEGQLAVESADDLLMYYANGEWRPVGSSTGSAGFAFDLRIPRFSTLAGNSWFAASAFTDFDMGYWVFKKDVDGKVYGIIRVGGTAPTTPTVALEIGAVATSGVTRLNIKTGAVGDGESMNPTMDVGTAQDITVPGTTTTRKTVTFTIPSTVVANDLILLEVFHEGSHANDTLAVNTLMWGAWLGDAG